MVYICPFGEDENGQCLFYEDPNCPIDQSTGQCVDCVSYNDNYVCIEYVEVPDTVDDTDNPSKPTTDPNPNTKLTSSQPFNQNNRENVTEASSDTSSNENSNDTMIIVMIILICVLIPLVIILGLIVYVYRKNKMNAVEVSMLRKFSTQRIAKEIDEKGEGKSTKKVDIFNKGIDEKAEAKGNKEDAEMLRAKMQLTDIPTDAEVKELLKGKTPFEKRMLLKEIEKAKQ